MILSENLISSGIISSVAAVNGMDYLLTWNCKHIANAEILRKVYLLCEREGYDCPIICTPFELMGGDAE